MYGRALVAPSLTLEKSSRWSVWTLHFTSEAWTERLMTPYDTELTATRIRRHCRRLVINSRFFIDLLASCQF